MKKNKKLIIPLLLVGILVLIIGSTYAWLIWVSSEEDKTNITFTATGNFSCSATGVNTIDGSNVTLVPTDCTKVENIGHVIKKEISTVSKNNSSADAYMNMWLNVDGLGSYLANSDNFKYALTTTDNNCATDVVSTGNFKDLATGGRVNILESKKITSTENNTYYLWIWLDEAETTPPEVDETTRSFSLSLGGECTNQEVVDNFTVTNKEVNYQNVKVTANNTQRNIVSYAIVNDTPSDTDWVAIQDVRKTCTLNRVLSTAGEYKVWFKDVDGNTISDTINIANIDTTGPVCTFGLFSKTQIKNQETSTLSLTCTDPETKIKDINLTKESFAYDNKLITISNIARENVSNGYKYTLTITGKGLDGDTSISLPSGNIKNNGDMNNTETSSSTLVILNSTSLSNLTVTLSNNTYTYDGKSKTPEVVVKDGIKKLTLNKDYTIEYKDNINAGTGKIVITGKGKYSGSTTKTFTINKATATCKINSVPTLKYPNSMSGNLTYNCTGTGNITVASGNTNVITASKTNDTVVSLTAKTIGTSKITISQAESTNYTSATISQDITVSAEEYTINFDGNIFNSISYTVNGLTVSYDYETSVLTLDGSVIETRDFLLTNGMSFTEGEKYNITLTNVSGSITKANSATAVFVMDIIDANGNLMSTRNFMDVWWPPENTTYTDAVTITALSEQAASGIKFWSWFSNMTGDVVFNNYKVKVDITKEETKRVSYGGTYGLLPVTYRKGFTFDGWYTGENGTGTKINSSDTVSITNDTTLYAKWIDDIGPYGTANLSLSSNTYTLTLSDQGDDGSGLNTTYGFALTTGTCEAATYENQTATSKTYSGTYTNGTTYYGCVKLTDKVGNISYIRSGGIKNVPSTTYTNSGEQVYTIPSTGIYKLEVWGAQGGTAKYSSKTYNGGYGGYSTGETYFNKDQILYINIGGMGQSVSGTTDYTDDNGYNGGSYGTAYSSNSNHGGGGGATHIAKVSGVLSTLSSQTTNILIVAGGGGGASSHKSAASYSGTGGSGGGYVGGNGKSANTTCYAYGLGGTQSGGGTYKTCSSDGRTPSTPRPSDAGFGFGSGITSFITSTGERQYATGGGGYYGGGYGYHAPAGGGSGYIGNSLLNNKYMYCYNCETSDEESTKTYTTTNVSDTPTADYAKSGSGAARITFTATTLKLTYNNNGGTGCNTKSVMTGEAYGELCTPIREGYKFDGWYTAESGGTKITASTSVSNNSDHTIYAHWTKAINPIISFGTNGNSGYVKGNVSSKITVSRGNANLDESTYKYIYSTSNSATPNTSFTSGNSYTLDGATGTYYLIAKACDVDGKCTTEVSNPFYVDNTAPSGTVQLSLDGAVLLANVSATDTGSGIKEYGYLIQKDNATCPTSGYVVSSNSNYTFNLSESGTYTVCVKLIDGVDNSVIVSNNIVASNVRLTYALISSNYSCSNSSVGSSPLFTYTGNCEIVDDSNDNWKIRFLTSGNLTFTRDVDIDVFLVGGGGSGSIVYGGAGGGGGSGYTKSASTSIVKNTSYSIVIGDGGAGLSDTYSGSGNNGGASSAFNFTASGGFGGSEFDGGAGGSGGGAGGFQQSAGKGGTDGGNGSGTTSVGLGSATAGTAGNGQGTSTREFYEIDKNTSAQLYAGAGGGGACALNKTNVAKVSAGDAGDLTAGKGTVCNFDGKTTGATAGVANTGGGGGGSATTSYYGRGTNNYVGSSGAGGSGIIIIRNSRVSGDSSNVIINGAPGEVITYTGTESGSIEIGSGGYSLATLLNGNYTFTSNISKSISNVSNNYSKEVTVSPNVSTIDFYPEGAVYWYGNGDASIDPLYSKTNGVTSDHIETNRFYAFYHAYSTSLGSNTSIVKNISIKKSDGTKYSKLKIVYQTGYESKDYYCYDGKCYQNLAYLEMYNASTNSKISSNTVSSVNTDKIYTVDLTSSSYSSVDNVRIQAVATAQNGPRCSIIVYAVWLE